MKTKQNIITKSIARTLPIALLASSIIAGPRATFARERSRVGGAEKRPDITREEQAPTNAREKTETQKIDRTEAHSRIASRFAKLDERLASTTVTENVRLHRDRTTRTREYLYGLVDLGTPYWEINAWMDALWADEIVAGMPADLVVDYWGDPLLATDIVIEGAPAKVWKYRVHPGVTERVTVTNGFVRSVHRA